jgi:hypothetical protein
MSQGVCIALNAYANNDEYGGWDDPEYENTNENGENHDGTDGEDDMADNNESSDNDGGDGGQDDIDDGDDVDYDENSDDNEDEDHGIHGGEDNISDGVLDSGGVLDSDGDEVENKRIEKFILRTLKAKVKFGWSREEALQQLQNFYEHEQNDKIPYKSWHKVIEFLKHIGYKGFQSLFCR